jgi:hypothetical protein
LSSHGERLLDLLVFAPAGIALTVAEQLPEFAEKGRNRIEGQTATARVLGQFVVQMGYREITKRARQLIDGGAPAPESARPRSEPSGEPTPGLVTPASVAPQHVREVQSEPPQTSTNGRVSDAELAIPAYDTLSASQVVKRLAGLSRDELLEVAEHERSNRHRATILNKVEQLLVAPSDPNLPSGIASEPVHENP